jgi:hypothetical protein
VNAEGAHFDYFVDECGTVSSDVDDSPYGFGFFLAERGADTDALEATLAAAHPDGSHFTEVPRPAKLAHAQRLLGLVPKQGHFYGGAHVVVDPSYARTILADYLSGKSPGLTEAKLNSLISTASVGRNGLIDARELLAPVHASGRLMAIYLNALRHPIFGLLRAPGCPLHVTVHVNLGVVADPTTHMRKLALMADVMVRSSREVFDAAFASGALPPRVLNLEITTTGRSPLFDLADLFAGIGWHAAQRRELGRDLVAAARDVLTRLPIEVKSSELLGDGIVIIRDRTVRGHSALRSGAG